MQTNTHTHTVNMLTANTLAMTSICSEGFCATFTESWAFFLLSLKLWITILGSVDEDFSNFTPLASSKVLSLATLE